MERPRRIGCPRPGRGRVVVPAVAGLVAHRPGEDRGVVDVPLDHPRDAGHPLVQVARVVAERAPERVRLDVRLVDHPEAELVGQVEEGRVVRVVRGAHGVEPELLHQDEVGPHRLARDHAPGVLVEVVAVDAVDQDPPAVEQEVAPDDLDPAEADPLAGLVRHRAGRVAERDPDLLEMGSLRRPRGHRGEGQPVRDDADGRRVEPGVERRPARLGLVLRARRVGGGARQQIGLGLGELVAGLGRRSSSGSSYRRSVPPIATSAVQPGPGRRRASRPRSAGRACPSSGRPPARRPPGRPRARPGPCGTGTRSG